ncbi:MAG: response regulator transcription factor [Pelagimonas sp.]|jgi:DNA-binding NarL/FixJ family response regulator|nr:response regulator transcription factor [Pelagimonas sp.]
MRILVADDHDLVRDTIAAYLCNGDVEEVQSAANLNEAMDLVHSSGTFDLVLLDYNMPGMNGLEGLTRMKKANSGGSVAILSGSASREVADAALRAGAQGFIPKTLSAKSLMSAARFMAAGEVYAPVDFLQSQPRETGSLLTKREHDVLCGICEGKSNKEIARDLELQEVTVKLHVKTLSRKLEARNRTHAAMIGRNRGLV